MRGVSKLEPGTALLVTALYEAGLRSASAIVRHGLTEYLADVIHDVERSGHGHAKLYECALVAWDRGLGAAIVTAWDVWEEHECADGRVTGDDGLALDLLRALAEGAMWRPAVGDYETPREELDVQRKGGVVTRLRRGLNVEGTMAYYAEEVE